MTNSRFGLSRSFGLVCLISLTACVSAPQGPRVAVMPTPGKVPARPMIEAIPPLMTPLVDVAVKENVPARSTGGLSR